MLKSTFINIVKLILITQIMGITVAFAEQSLPQIKKRIPWINPTPITNINSKKITEPPRLSDKEIFKQAFNKLMIGQYQPAIKDYKFILKNHTNSKLAGDCYFWIAEATYLSGKHEVAIDKYKYFLNNFPNNKNVTSAELRIKHSHNDVSK